MGAKRALRGNRGGAGLLRGEPGEQPCLLPLEHVGPTPPHPLSSQGEGSQQGAS
jgi:hypothetical protein